MSPLIKGRPLSTTVTIGALMEHLKTYPQEMPVAYTWEGQITPVDFSAFEVMQETDKVHGPVLLLDAET